MLDIITGQEYENMDMEYIVTHDGRPHPDDAMAVGTLLLIENLPVFRTRDQEVIKNAKYCIDIGFKYDPEAGRFDHHQNDPALTRENGIPYSSVGLVWKHFGNQICEDEVVAKELDELIIQEIDGWDNFSGHFNFNEYHLAKALVSFRYTNKNDDAFKLMSEMSQNILTNEISRAKKMRLDYLTSKPLIEERTNLYYVIINEPVNWHQAAIEDPNLLYVIWRKKDNSYMMQCVQKEIGSNNNRKSFPISWRGKDREELIRITGVNDAKFCHKGGFLLGAYSEEGILKLANLAISSEEE